MTIKPRQSGHIILAIIALIALAAIVYLGYQLIKAIEKTNWNNRYDTNVVDISWAPIVQDLQSNYPTVTTATVLVDGFALTATVDSLQYQWRYTVQSSTNLLDWVESDLDWPVALESVRTNHDEPCRFYRRVVQW